MLPQVRFAKDILPRENSELIVSCFGFAYAVGRVCSGLVADRPGIDRVMIQQVVFFAAGLAISLAPTSTNYVSVLTVAAVVGGADGAFFCMCGPIAFDLLGPEDAAQGLCCLFSLMSISVIFGPPFVGKVFARLVLPIDNKIMYLQ